MRGRNSGERFHFFGIGAAVDFQDPIFFANVDFNKTDLKPESAPALQEIAKLLEKESNLKLIVTGHTDNVGSFESNRDLSQRRAAAVVSTLVNQYHVAAARLVPFGASFAAPVAPNSSEEGRAKNRRVELVPF
jgi:OOP family OmpA-OmpF porin